MSLIDPVDSLSAGPVVQQEKADSSAGEDQGFSALLEQAGEVNETGPKEQASGLSMRRVLTSEEEKRLAELQDQLRQCLMDMVDHPSDETKRRIREIEDEIAELTGVKAKHKLAETVKKLPGQDDKDDKDDEDEQERKAHPLPGDLALELGIRPVPTDQADPKGIMSFYQQNLAAFLNKDIIYK